MLGQMQRRVMGWKREQDETDPGAPTYPVGRRNAVRVVGAGHIFFRVDGSRRSTFDVPVIVGGGLPAESGRIAERTWPLFRDANGSTFHTADYLSAPANIRNPTPAEDPDGNFRRVYDQRIDSVLVEVRNGAIAAKTTTGTQTFLVGARATIPGPGDAYLRKSQTGVKALGAFVIGNQVTWAQAPAEGAVNDGVANYPAVAINGRVGEFTLYAKYDPAGPRGSTSAGDTMVVNAPQRSIVSAAGAVFIDLGRPATEAEAPVNLERTF